MPTETQIQTAIGAGFYVSDFLRQQGGIEVDSFLQRVGSFVDLVGILRTSRAGVVNSGMAQVRGSYAAAVDGAPGWLAPLMRDYMDNLDIPTFGLTIDTQSLYDNFVKTGKRVKSRQFTYGPITTVPTPAGDGVIYVCNKDENDFDIENAFVEDITIECVLDQSNGGTKFKESFRFKGGAANIDNIVVAGSNNDQTSPGLSSDDSSAYFQNCSFSSANGSGVDLFDFWTLDVDDLADWTQDTAEFYQATPGDPVEASLKIVGNGIIYQTFALNNTSFPSDRPMLVRVPLKIAGVNAGTLIRLRFGEQVDEYTVTGAESGWFIPLVLEFSSRCWYKKFAKNGGRLALEVHGMSAGQINADNIIVAPMIPFDNLWYAPCAGATPFKIGDRFTRSITAVDNAIIQRFYVQHTGIYLPHDANSSAITWSEPVFHT